MTDSLTNRPRGDGQQADHLRRVAADLEAGAPPTADRVAVVFGAKGGVGTSAIAIAIARDLARSTASGEGVAVLAVDAHAGRNDLALMAHGDATPGLALTTAVKLGVEPVAGRGPAAAEVAKRLLRAGRLWTDDAGGWIVIDAGVGDTPWARELALRAHRPLLVTTPDRVATLNAYATIKRLDPIAERLGLIINHSGDAAQAAASHAALARCCERFLSSAPALAGWLPTLAEDPTEGAVQAAA